MGPRRVVVRVLWCATAQVLQSRDGWGRGTKTHCDADDPRGYPVAGLGLLQHVLGRDIPCEGWVGLETVNTREHTMARRRNIRRQIASAQSPAERAYVEQEALVAALGDVRREGDI